MAWYVWVLIVLATPTILLTVAVAMFGLFVILHTLKPNDRLNWCAGCGKAGEWVDRSSIGYRLCPECALFLAKEPRE